MQIWVDADACPRVIRDILLRAAARRSVVVTLVANAPMPIRRTPNVKLVRVPSGFDEADRYIEFAPTSLLVRLLMPRISFTIDPCEDGCTFTQRIRVRTGPIGTWLNRREFDAVRVHMREEGENLRALLEESSDPTTA